MTKIEKLHRISHIIQYAMEGLIPDSGEYERDAECLAYIMDEIHTYDDCAPHTHDDCAPHPDQLSLLE